MKKFPYETPAAEILHLGYETNFCSVQVAPPGLGREEDDDLA